MKAAIITIGDELLIGQIVDTNAAYLAKVLDEHGFQVTEMRSIADTQEAIAASMSSFLHKVDLVVMTGGLGPTKDDVTKKAFCAFFDDMLVQNDEVYAHVKNLMEKYYRRPISEINKMQAWVPSRAHVLFNDVGTAPGMLMKKGQTSFVSLPGVPFEMKHIVENELVPYLGNEFSPYYNVHQTIVTQGIGESLLAEEIEVWENSLPPSVSLAYLPSPGMVKLRLTTRGTNREKLVNELANYAHELEHYIAAYLIGFDAFTSLALAVKNRLEKENLTISVAESCTGGKIAQNITAIPGCSAVFKGGVVTYATESKVAILDVSETDIVQYGVVSEQVAVSMAKGVKRIFSSDVAIATTGNAGPTKEIGQAEVGEVCIALVTETEALSWTFHFGSPREKVIDLAVNKALELLYKALVKK